MMRLVLLASLLSAAAAQAPPAKAPTVQLPKVEPAQQAKVTPAQLFVASASATPLQLAKAKAESKVVPPQTAPAAAGEHALLSAARPLRPPLSASPCERRLQVGHDDSRRLPRWPSPARFDEQCQ